MTEKPRAAVADPEDDIDLKKDVKEPVDSEPPAKPRRPKIADHISRQLKAVYDDMLDQPVPDRFLELLRALEDKKDAS